MRIFVLALAFLLGGCTGFSASFGTPADSDQYELEVTPVTVDLVNSIRRRKMKSSESVPLPSLNPRGDFDYKIGVRDVLSISVPTIASPGQVSNKLEAQQTQGYVVHSDGTIVLPFVGELSVVGLTIAQAQQRITSEMSRFLTRPQFNVRVVEFRSQRALIIGEVSNPGYQQITDVPLNILDTITAAGGATDNADLSRIVVRRGGKQFTVNLDAIFQASDWLQNVQVQHGDVLLIPSKSVGEVFVLGEVNRPSIQEILIDSTSLADVLGRAGFVRANTANPEKIYVIRGDVVRPQVFHLNGENVESLLLADAFPLEPRDVVYVSAAGIVKWNRFLAQLLPAIQGLLTPVLIQDTIQDVENNRN